MAIYTYDEEAKALYVLLVSESEAAINRTVELNPRLHVDLDESDRVVGVEVLFPDGEIDMSPVVERFGVEVRIPFHFAA